MNLIDRDRVSEAPVATAFLVVVWAFYAGRLLIESFVGREAAVALFYVQYARLETSGRG